MPWIVQKKLSDSVIDAVHLKSAAWERLTKDTKIAGAILFHQMTNQKFSFIQIQFHQFHFEIGLRAVEKQL